MEDVYIGKKVYRIVSWEDNPRQEFPYHIIHSNYDGGDWQEVKGFESLEEAKQYIERVLVK